MVQLLFVFFKEIKILAKLLYPSMKGTRNLILKIKKIDQLNNLDI